MSPFLPERDRAQARIINASAHSRRRVNVVNADAGGRDEVTCQIALGSAVGRLVVEVGLLYQCVPPEAVERLLNGRGPAAKEFSRLYGRAQRRPEVVHQALIEL